MVHAILIKYPPSLIKQGFLTLCQIECVHEFMRWLVYYEYISKTANHKEELKMENKNMVSLAPINQKLEELFQIFNEKFFGSALPKPVITIAGKGNMKASGWCTREKVWGDEKENRYYEINICSEFLSRPIEEVCETLLHEMCHLYNASRGKHDCSKTSQYHNKTFKECAEKHGLNVEQDKNRGFAITSLKPETLEFIQSLGIGKFDLCRDERKRNEKGNMVAGKELKKSSTRKYVCPKCRDSVRATKIKNIICGDCDMKMEIEG